MRLLLSLFLISAAAMSAPNAWAKKVSLEWKSIRGAVQYEIQVQQDGKVVSQKKLKDTAWSSELQPGIYLYQVRGFDRIKRPGQWSAPKPLVVMPPPPETEFPGDGNKVVMYQPSASTALKWNATPGIKKYRLEVKKGNQVVYSEVVEGTQHTMKALPPGDYKWQVTSVMELSGRAPASVGRTSWQGKASDVSEFKVEHARLGQPVPVTPLGTIEPSSDGKTKFKWKSVEGAEAYELTLIPKKLKGRQIASTETGTRVVVSDNVAVMNVPSEGRYAWRVRALANIDEKKQPEAAGPQSTAEFSVDKNAGYFEGGGYVAISTMIAPYTYQVISPSTNNNGSASSSALTYRGSAEYWFHPQWGISGAGEITQFSISSQSYSRKGFELFAKYRFKFGDAKRGWVFSPKLGAETRDYFEILRGATATDPMFNVASTVYGATAGFDLRKQITDRMSVGVKFAYFKPLMLSSSDGAESLTGDASNRNWSVGAQMFYWLGGHWGLGAGVYMEKRSISYTFKGASSDLAAEQVFMDGNYFFGTLMYTFGK